MTLLVALADISDRLTALPGGLTGVHAVAPPQPTYPYARVSHIAGRLRSGAGDWRDDLHVVQIDIWSRPSGRDRSTVEVHTLGEAARTALDGKVFNGASGSATVSEFRISQPDPVTWRAMLTLNIQIGDC